VIPQILKLPVGRIRGNASAQQFGRGLGCARQRLPHVRARFPGGPEEPDRWDWLTM